MAILRRNVLVVAFLALVLLAGKGVTEARLSLTSLPSLRGGYAALAPPIPVQKSPPRPALFGVVNIQRTITHIGGKIQSETSRQWNGLASSIGRVFSREEIAGAGNLDDVLKAFKSVLNGSEVDMAQLLKACRAHLLLMKSGGTVLRVIAKDLEGNIDKAETMFKKLRKEDRRYLASLLEVERASGIHEGNSLQSESAAAGLLWIRRSLAFQLDLYASLIPANGRHPKDAAMDAYYKTLSPYHGWMLQKAFPLSFSSMPDRTVFLAKFGGREPDDLDEAYERDVVKKLKALVATWEPIIDVWSNEFERLDLEDPRRV
ncbi:hypothetical protein ACHAXT_005359 [Thalassiosira profunda]